ncbi:MAG TPA: methyltransferase domain-containing protein [archaeon]|nr:methyltransferase domain-containing protein [archaeon]
MLTELVNKKILALHFSKSAESYDKLAVLQREIAYQLVDWASSGKEFKAGRLAVLEIGCGTGFLTGFLSQRLKSKVFVAVDLARGMLNQARIKLHESRAGVKLVQADGENLPLPPCSFDLVVSSTAFQWFNSFEKSIAGIHRLLRPGGRLIFATLGRGTFRELKEAYRTAAGQMGIKLASARYGLPFIGALEVRDCLIQAGFKGAAVKQYRKFEFFPSSRDFLLSIKKRGANNPDFRPMSLRVERDLLGKMASFYDTRFKVDGHVYASYEVIFAKGEKPGGR